MVDRRTEVLALLTETAQTRDRATEDRDTLIREGVALDIPKATLAAAAKLSRRAVYDIIERET